MPTDVKFYHLTRDRLEQVLPRLAARALEQNLRVLIRAPDDARVSALDALLWTYEDDSFLPHGTARNSHADLQPIFISSASDVPNGATLLMLVDNRLDEDISAFEKCFYLFDGRDEAQVAQARQHWSKLKSNGLDLSYWQQSDAGRWEKKA
jgi:DNA polymerase III subunit chi